MIKTVAQIAQLLGGEVVGDGETKISGLASLAEAQQGQITFLDAAKYEPLVKTTGASAIIVSRDAEIAHKTFIRVDDPRLAFAKVMRFFYPSGPEAPQGIHPTVVMGPGVQLGQNVCIGAYVSIGEKASIGDDTIIFPAVFIGDESCIGKKSVLYPHVTLRERVVIGNNVIIHSGTVIGSDGFGYAQEAGRYLKIPQVGTVVVEDDVEIGANVTIDRGTLGDTRIGQGTKIDNLVQIAHNVVIGPNSVLVSQVGISGSTRIGAGVILAGQVGVVGHIEIGDGSVIGAQSGVHKSVPPSSIMFGYPARSISQTKRIEACLSRLPELFKRVKKLEKQKPPPKEEGE